MKSKERKLMLMECINENLNSVIINQERIYCQLVEMMKKNGQAGERSERYYKN